MYERKSLNARAFIPIELQFFFCYESEKFTNAPVSICIAVQIRNER